MHFVAMKLPHWAQLVLGLAVVVITWIMAQNASGQLVLPAILVTVLTIVKTTIGMLTDSVSTSSARTTGGRAVAIALWLTVGIFGARTLTACALAAKAAPSGAALLACIVDDAAKGDGIAQIAEDCDTDVPAVIGALVSKTAPPKVRATAAYNEAQRTLAVSVSP